jgi:hypothetical protein
MWSLHGCCCGAAGDSEAGLRIGRQRIALPDGAVCVTRTSSTAIAIGSLGEGLFQSFIEKIVDMRAAPAASAAGAGRFVFIISP